MRKISSILLLVAILSTSLAPLALAKEAEVISSEEPEVVVTRAEELEWKFAYIGGVLHKRLWSLTYGKWLTDWMVA